MIEITDHIKQLVDLALQEDLGDHGDITTKSTIPSEKTMSADIVSRETGIIAGCEIAKYVFNIFDPTLEVEIHIQDGKKVIKDDKILTIKGNAQNILQAERTALNFLTHLSGIATETARYVDAVSHTEAKILDTRKTLPGWRILQKHAVKMGGGQNHRMGLHDMVLIKDNHIAVSGSIENALNAVKGKSNFIQIEVDTIEQLQQVLKNGNADSVLLDNMNLEQLKNAVQIIDKKLVTEASGGITLENVKDIAETGINRISIGALTHTITPIDFGLDYSE
jgi:nicotinate-nucleotide pyrophosphorylase (carboxylating)